VREEELRSMTNRVPVGASLAAWIGAVLSSLCCLLPLTVIVLGLGSGAFMAVRKMSSRMRQSASEICESPS